MHPKLSKNTGALLQAHRCRLPRHGPRRVVSGGCKLLELRGLSGFFVLLFWGVGWVGGGLGLSGCLTCYGVFRAFWGLGSVF